MGLNIHIFSLSYSRSKDFRGQKNVHPHVLPVTYASEFMYNECLSSKIKHIAPDLGVQEQNSSECHQANVKQSLNRQVHKVYLCSSVRPSVYHFQRSMKPFDQSMSNFTRSLHEKGARNFVLMVYVT